MHTANCTIPCHQLSLTHSHLSPFLFIGNVAQTRDGWRWRAEEKHRLVALLLVFCQGVKEREKKEDDHLWLRYHFASHRHSIEVVHKKTRRIYCKSHYSSRRIWKDEIAIGFSYCFVAGSSGTTRRSNLAYPIPVAGLTYSPRSSNPPLSLPLDFSL